MARYRVISALDHDNQRYQVGESIELEEQHATPLIGRAIELAPAPPPASQTNTPPAEAKVEETPAPPPAAEQVSAPAEESAVKKPAKPVKRPSAGTGRAQS